jgi:hypothetical protein
MSERRRPDPYREEELRQALVTDARVAQPDLQVRLSEGRVIVTGSLPTHERRDAVEEVLHELAGDLQIDDQTVVAAMAPGGHEEDLR